MATKEKIRVRITAVNVAGEKLGTRYIYQNAKGEWRCTGAAGTPLAMSDSLKDHDEMALIFELEDASSGAEAVKAVRRRLAHGLECELVE